MNIQTDVLTQRFAATEERSLVHDAHRRLATVSRPKHIPCVSPVLAVSSISSSPARDLQPSLPSVVSAALNSTVHNHDTADDQDAEGDSANGNGLTAPPSQAPDLRPSQPSDASVTVDAVQSQQIDDTNDNDDGGLEDGNGEGDGDGDGDGGQGNSDGDAQPQQSRPSAPTSSALVATAPNNVWERSKPVPGSKNNTRIYPHAPFRCAEWSDDRLMARFEEVRRKLEDMVYRHLRLQHLESRLVFAARMVGTCPSDARPSVVVTCQEADFKRIRNLFRSRAEGPLCLGKPPRSRFPFGQRLASDESTDPRLGLVYYRTKTATVIRSALDKPLLAQLRKDGISCGGVVRYGERTATLGVALEFGEHRGILTVDHLMPPQNTQMPPSSALKGDAFPPAGSSSPLPWEHDSPGSDILWDDDDEYGELDPDEAPDPMYLDFKVAPGDSFGPPAYSWSAQSDRAHWPEGKPEEWTILASSAQLALSAEYLDWALIWPESSAQCVSLSRLNTIFPEGPGSQGVVLEAFQEHVLTSVAAVYIVSGLRGILHGQILAVPSYLPSAPGQESCRAWTVILNAIHGPIMSGECGSVVVDQETNRVYGHVVGNDPLGHAYVVSLAHVLKQVNRCFTTDPCPQLAAPLNNTRSSSKVLGRQPLSIDTPHGLPCGPNLVQTDEEGFPTPANLVTAGTSVPSAANTTECETPTPHAPISPDDLHADFLDAYDSAAECSSADATECSSTIETETSDMSSGSEVDSDRESCTFSDTKDQRHQTPEAVPLCFEPDFGETTDHAVHPSSKFRPGAIFKIIWSEPLGFGGPRNEALNVHRTGNAFYQGLRRFIVVANDEGHCTCVPILTYERQGCNKKGVRPLQHGIIYQAGKKPRMLAGESKLGFAPVRARLREKTEQLVKESRVNYAKLQTVEHNCQVYFIGKVDPEDFRNIVIPAVDLCWERKWRDNSTFRAGLGRAVHDGSITPATKFPDVAQGHH